MLRKSVITSKRSRLSLSTFKLISKRVKIASSTSFATFTSMLRNQKLYLTIDDLNRMFREKFKSFDLSQHQKRRSSLQRFDVRSYQSRIIIYFLSAINQKTSITQSLKSSKSKTFQQHMFAKSIRSTSALSEKSIFSSYKKSDIFYISLQSRFSSRFSF